MHTLGTKSGGHMTEIRSASSHTKVSKEDDPVLPRIDLNSEPTEGWEFFDIWTGETVKKASHADGDGRNSRVLTILLDRCRGPLKAEDVLHLSQVILNNGSVYDFHLQIVTGERPNETESLPGELIQSIFSATNSLGFSALQLFLRETFGKISVESKD